MKATAKTRSKKTVMDLLRKRNLHAMSDVAVFGKTPSVVNKLVDLGVNAEIASVGLDISVIPDNIPSKQELRQKLGFSEDDFILIFVGRMESYKNPDLAVEQLNRLNDRYKLIMIGSGSLESKVTELIDKLDLTARVKFMKSVKNTEIHQYYKAADAFLNLNDHEIFGMSILEAMYQECPVVALSAPGPDYIVDSGKTGFIVKKPEEVSDALIKINNEMGRNAKNRIVNKFTWEKTCDTIIHKLRENGVNI